MRLPAHKHLLLHTQKDPSRMTIRYAGMTQRWSAKFALLMQNMQGFLTASETHDCALIKNPKKIKYFPVGKAAYGRV